jgi:SAM-dependent methyltransferase
MLAAVAMKLGVRLVRLVRQVRLVRNLLRHVTLRPQAVSAYRALPTGEPAHTALAGASRDDRDVTNGSTGWKWDETLYAGAARYYPAGRMPYPDSLARAIRGELGRGGTGRLLDVGCGPGSLTLMLAPLFESSTGIDGSNEMIAMAKTGAERAGVTNIDWIVRRAENIGPDLGKFRAVTFAQSFHWLNRPKVAGLVLEVLEPGGGCVVVYATTHAGVDGTGPLPLPRPPRAEIDGLIAAYLGSTRRAGRGTRSVAGRPGDDTGRSDEDILAGAGLRLAAELTIAASPLRYRGEDEIVASVFSLSYAAPALFGSGRADFERDLRDLLRRTSPDRQFCEQPRDIRINVWRPAP